MTKLLFNCNIVHCTCIPFQIESLTTHRHTRALKWFACDDKLYESLNPYGQFIIYDDAHQAANIHTQHMCMKNTCQVLCAGEKYIMSMMNVGVNPTPNLLICSVD